MRRAKNARSKAAREAKNKETAALQARLGYEFKDLSILNEALTHPGSVGISKKVKLTDYPKKSPIWKMTE